MVYANDNDATTNEESILSNLFGGLNTTSTSVNVPVEDSPYLLNADVSVSGAIQKRKGTQVVGEFSTLPSGVVAMPFTSGLGYNFLLAKEGTSLRVYQVVDHQVQALMTKANVWSTEVANVKAAAAYTSEVEPRVVFCTGRNAPVQLKFAEQSQAVNPSTATTSAVVTDASRFSGATTGNTLVFLNRVWVPNPTFSYSGTSLTVGNLPSHVGSNTVDVMNVTWQWWAESLRFFGYEFFDSTTRFHAVQTDQSVAVPSGIWGGVSPTINPVNGLYPFRTYRTTKNDSAFTLQTNDEPSTDAQYAFSDGTRYVYAAGTKVNPSPLFITFGTITANSTPTSVYFSRGQLLTFNGGRGASASQIDVVVDGATKPYNTTTTYGSYLLRGDNYVPFANTDTSSVGRYLSFEACTTIGVPKISEVQVVFKAPNGNAGSSATSSGGKYLDGSYWPAFGLGNFSNYGAKAHPRNVQVYQGRLVFSGFLNNPLLVLFSNVFDSTTPGVAFNYFQVDLQSTGTVDPFDVLLGSTADDRVVGLVEWQRSLFVLTRRAVFRVHGGQETLSQSARFVDYVSNNGLVNPFCMVRTDKEVLYLSDIGVLSINPAEDTAGSLYAATEKSLKVRKFFGLTTDPAYETLPWMTYDSVSTNVYVGLPVKGLTTTTEALLVYNTFRQAWTQYDTPGNFRGLHMTPYTDRSKGLGVLMLCTTGPTNYTFLRFNAERYADFVKRHVGSGSSQTLTTPVFPKVIHTTVANVHEYGVSREKTGQRGFTTLLLAEVQDLVVILNGKRLQLNVDYFKRPNGTIYLMQPPLGGKSLTIQTRRPVTDTYEGQVTHQASTPVDTRHVLVWVDNIVKREGVDYNYPNDTSITLTTRVNAAIEVGQAYLSVYTSPLFTREDLSRFKRLKHIYTYFDNALGNDVFQVGDQNSSSGQPVQEIAGELKQRLNANVSCVYNSEYSGSTSADIYGFGDIVWDVATMDISPPGATYEAYQLFKEPIQGVGHSFQLLLWSYDETTFTLVAYQIDGKKKGKRYRNEVS
jgi:hypothetical protein